MHTPRSIDEKMFLQLRIFLREFTGRLTSSNFCKLSGSRSPYFEGARFVLDQLSFSSLMCNGSVTFAFNRSLQRSSILSTKKMGLLPKRILVYFLKISCLFFKNKQEHVLRASFKKYFLSYLFTYIFVLTILFIKTYFERKLFCFNKIDLKEIFLC